MIGGIEETHNLNISAFKNMHLPADLKSFSIRVGKVLLVKRLCLLLGWINYKVSLLSNVY